MKKLGIVALAVCSASPAYATGELVCRTAGSRPLEVSMVIGHTAVSSVVSARLADAGSEVPIAVAQSWLEPNEVRLDLTNGDATRYEARLRARRNGQFYDGHIWRSGKRRWVRCHEG